MNDPGYLLDQFKARSNARKQRSLQIIDAICREQHERGSPDFTIATVGKLSTQRGGPTSQAIRNKSGVDYRALIAGWAEHTGGMPKRPVSNKASSGDEALLKRIADPVIRAEVGFLLAETRKLRGQVRLLQQTVQHHIVIDQRHTVPPRPDAEVLLATDLSDLERDALAHAISEGCLAENGWKVDRRGALVDATSGRRVFKNGFITALRKVLAQQKT
ncbi:hypothetical protein IIE18_12135 [Pseudomonas sp. V1]|uniref:gamma-mobile-trio protein GmtX n=1 Tax=Pseudomonas arcuscaelestis TaxID=2710591 RepID=UPI00193F1774|nr:gamma-mobile-trio protein GmtX [Pseudomonas arcuscaelestis]MBM3105887.1 hypothetical protein [Pseudomonas arcuscaelestis]